MADSDKGTVYQKLRRWSRSIIGFGLVRILAPVIRRLTDRKYFYAFERRGVHVTPIHFYQPIPDTRTLSATRKVAGVNLPGINFQAEKQRGLLTLFAAKYGAEYRRFSAAQDETKSPFFLDNNAFGRVDAEILHCMVRHLRPKRIIEIGCGYSTLVATGAIKITKDRDSRYSCDLTGIDPYPPAVLGQVNGLMRLIRKPVQSVAYEEFHGLRRNDILFIDSSHVLTTESDVRFELLEILPRLRAGVYVHFHDVFLPADYPHDWALEQALFWNEQYAIQSFLGFNDSFEIVWASSLMSLRYPKDLQRAIPSFDPQGPKPASIWIRRVK